MTWWRWLLVFATFDIALRAATAAGVPACRAWPPFDAHDVGTICATLVFLAVRPTPPKAEADHG